MEKLPNGPFETEREARAAAHEVVRPEYGCSILSKPQNLLLLERACETAGVKLGAYDQRILDWLSGFEDSMCAVVARAVSAGRPGPRCVTFDLTSDHHAEMYFVLTQALEDFAVRERDQAAWEEGNSSRERWADLADTMRAQVETARNGSR